LIDFNRAQASVGQPAGDKAGLKKQIAEFAAGFAGTN
jgi:hypothetical protein